jgi:hypothetical protein
MRLQRLLKADKSLATTRAFRTDLGYDGDLLKSTEANFEAYVVPA